MPIDLLYFTFHVTVCFSNYDGDDSGIDNYDSDDGGRGTLTTDDDDHGDEDGITDMIVSDACGCQGGIGLRVLLQTSSYVNLR